jgi:hypothetical protein
MPIDPRKRQKQQERRAAKRKVKQHQRTREQHAGLAERLTAAAGAPILHSWATDDLWNQGLGWVCLSRLLSNGSVAYAVFLVDRYCLGVKNAMAGITDRYEYDSRIARKMRTTFGSREIPPAAARRFVEGAVAYAEALGLHPHADYHKAKPLFGTIDASESTEELEFGKDGKPFFVAGPHDSPQRCRQILNTLAESCGMGGFEFLIPFTEGGEFLPE